MWHLSHPLVATLIVKANITFILLYFHQVNHRNGWLFFSLSTSRGAKVGCLRFFAVMYSPNRNWYIVFHLRLQWLCIRRFVGNCPRIIMIVMMTTMRWQNTVNYDNDDDNDNVNHDNDYDVHIMMKFMRVCVSRWMCWQIIFFVFVLQTKNL